MSTHLPGEAHAATVILGQQGRSRADAGTTVAEATGNVAPGRAGGVKGKIGVAAALRDALPADAATDALRWAAQQRILLEARRARAEHAISLLSREVGREAKRQMRLRAAAAKFATSEARARGEDWTIYAAGAAALDADSEESRVASRAALGAASGRRVGGGKAASEKWVAPSTHTFGAGSGTGAR
jgi:hypothetical protein